MDRRQVLAGLMACFAAPVRAQQEGASGGAADPEVPGLQLGTPDPFAPEDVRELARALAAEPYTAPQRIPEAWTSIDYDQYRAIWFDPRNALWNASGKEPFRMDVFAPGLYYPTPIDIAVVENGEARPVLFDLEVFDRTDQFPDLPIDETLGYSGFRLRAELERPDVFTEFAVFQGASYFRGIGASQIYGLSARGLAIDTAEPEGEEFPEFRRFWIERPAPGAKTLVVHALLDSPRATGAYRFVLRPGRRLEIGVEAEIFAREQLDHVGLAPLTSMFQFDETNRHRFSDFRSAIHDSDGLLIHNGAGESLWRALANPKTLQVSVFVDDSPRGFGLMQRARAFEDYGDLEALYHRRPSLWIAPREDWGPGAVTLVEIPTDDEVYDNIVAYWRPSEPLSPGSSRRFAYDMTWSAQSDHATGLRVLNTRAGRGRDGGIRFAIDFEDGDALPDDLSKVDTLVRSAGGGELGPAIVERNPETGGARLGFSLFPNEAPLVEMRAQLRMDGAPLSEVWLYRWTA
ncbi:Glucans biosynthesis protein G precursor [Roseivivax jejudonensis]|uniref:Glucans biosynthesis protein G n=1 Tax=Roseivivax jejudonensis TaxID=1529041 RepID=A0A1X6Z5B5_9RHOB|nr:glucan biosynthesis protein G [Roseivivax jejudonensis]SLN40472.1 Glucans biosynthesis protein G precursor [Roseivivax jejudonensis]